MQIDIGRRDRSFEEVLAAETGWAPPYAAQVAGEYRRFLYLAATFGREVTPSKAVDEAWHLHLSLPHYQDVLCREIVGHSIAHREGSGDVADEARFARQYEETLLLYEAEFGPPPAWIWPRPQVAPAPSRAPLLLTLLGGLAVLLFFAGLLAGEHALVIAALVAMLVTAIIAFVDYGTRLKGRQESRYAGSCGGGGVVFMGGTDGCGDVSGAGDGCGASCGGGGCGGGD